MDSSLPYDFFRKIADFGSGETSVLLFLYMYVDVFW